MDCVGRVYATVVGELRERWPDAKVFPSLDREAMLVDMLGSPHIACPVVHVGGTNGKSSVTRMVDSLLRSVGLRTGRFTSPDFDLIERIAIHGSPLSEDRFIELYEEIRPYIDVVDSSFPQRLTAFEVMTAMAFAAFADAPTDAAVIEVGMGGAWDCTNVTHGKVSVVTPISLDHQEYLGDSLESIAEEKVGIVKPDSVVIAARQDPSVERIIIERCESVGATIAREGHEFGIISRAIAVGGQVITLQGLSGVYENIFLPLHGAHQAQNAALALAAVEAFLGAGVERSLDRGFVDSGFASVSCPGRIERVRSSPTILLDAAHNPAGIASTLRAVEEDFQFRRLIAVVSIFEDKDVNAMLELMEPMVDVLVVTRNTSPRAMRTALLSRMAVDIFGDDRVRVEKALPDAIDMAVTLAESDIDAEPGAVGVLVTGSIATVADARRLFRR